MRIFSWIAEMRYGRLDGLNQYRMSSRMPLRLGAKSGRAVSFCDMPA